VDELRNELTELQKTLRDYAKELLPIVEELHKKTAMTDDHIVKIVAKGYDRDNYQYKEAFETALEKVNTQTRRVLNQILEDHKTITTVLPRYTAAKTKESAVIDENIIDRVKAIIDGITKKASRWLADIRKLDIPIKELERLSKQSK